jgi:outer membrane protein OmpA-like peptidoglycan-associated protein
MIGFRATRGLVIPAIALAAMLMATDIASASLTGDAQRPVVNAQVADNANAKQADLQQDVQAPKDTPQESKGAQDSQAKSDSQGQRDSHKVRAERSETHDWAKVFTRRIKSFGRSWRVRW